MRCKKCAMMLKDGAKFCPGCGTKVEEDAPAAPAPDANGTEICKNCGKEIKAGAKFCPFCGGKNEPVPAAPAAPQAPAAPVPPAAPQAPGAPVPPQAPGAPVPPQAPGAPAPQMMNPNQFPGQPGMQPGMPGVAVATRPKKPFPLVPVLIAAGALVVIIVGIIILVNVLNQPPKINLNDYVTVKADSYSYEGSGYATASADKTKLKADWDGKLSVNRGSEYASYFSSSAEATTILASFISSNISLEENSNLKNGDKVKVVWDISEEEKAQLRSLVNCDIEYSDFEKEVTGFKTVETVDIFENIKVVFEGTAPDGKARISNNSKYYSIKFELDKADGLSNGDKVKVKATLSDYSSYNSVEEALAKSHHVKAKSLEKEYTVSGLQKVATKVSEIPADCLEKMKSGVTDSIKADIAGSYSSDSISFKSADYCGTIILTPKEGSYNTARRYFVVFKVTLTTKYEKNNKKVTEDFTYFTCGEYKNIFILEDGKATPENGFTPYTSGYLSVPNTYASVDGYADYDSLFTKIVTANLTGYDYDDSDIKIKA